MKKVLVVLAQGAEEMEAVIVVDVLRRAGLEVYLGGLDGSEAVICSRKVKLTPDGPLSDYKGSVDAVVLPGGAEGARRLAESEAVGTLLQDAERSEVLVGAICAAPIALASAGVGAGRRMTSHPAVREKMEDHCVYSEERVVKDGLFITSRGPGTAFEFALALIAELAGSEKADEIAGPMILPQP